MDNKEIMTVDDRFTSMRSLIGVLAKSMNLINPEVEGHHEMTAYLSYMLAKEMGCDTPMLHKVIYASLLHDIGAVASEEQQSVEELEAEAYTIAAFGADMLRELDELKEIADIVEFCQCGYATIMGALELGQIKSATTAKLASVIHLADRATVMLDPHKRVLSQLNTMETLIAGYSGIEFDPEAVEALTHICRDEYVWFDLFYDPWSVLDIAGLDIPVTLTETASLTRVMSKIVDYRSAFTAMHSAGVSASAASIAKFAGMDERDCLMMEIGGYLHDLGKLVVPKAILEKPGRLTDEEFNIIKEHPYYTTAILKNAEGFDKIAHWAGNHHEKLNGKGYPYHLTAADLELGDRIMSVADIFAAITETRPYRDGMNREQAMKVMNENVEYGSVDGDIVAILHDNYDAIDGIRDEISRERGKRYFDSMR